MGDHVFICYARDDQEFVFKLVTSLKDRGVPVWLDQWDIPFGADWDQAIDNALSDCARFLLVLSPKAVESKEVRGELRTALNAGKSIIPVLHQACRIPRQLQVIQHVDFTARGLDDETILNRLVHALHVPESVLPESGEKALKEETERREREQAAQEQGQRAVEAGRLRMKEARTAAERAGAREQLAEVFTTAQSQAEQGHVYEERGEFVQALSFYERAAELFAQLGREAAVRAAREDAEAARQRMRKVRERVSALQEWAESLWAEAQQEENRAEQAYEAQTSEQAIAGYERASQVYEQVGVVGEHERLRQDTLQTQQQAAAARAETEQAEAGRYAAGLWSQAVAAQGEADQRWQAQQFVEAAQGYRQARELFQQAVREAQRERTKQAAIVLRAAQERAEAARQRLEEVKEGRETLGQWRGEKGADATAQETAAARAWQAQDYEQAAEAYERARQLYEKERKEAEEAQLRQQALTARQQADQTQTAAEQADAQQHAHELYQRAIEAKRQGEQNLAVKRWKEAAEEFVRAQGFFAQAFHSAQREKARQTAAVAHERMGEARAKAEQAKAHERFTAEFTRAQHLAAQGQAREEREEFVQAAELYEQAERHFMQLFQRAIDQAAQEDAQDARRQMGEVKERVRTLRPWVESFWAEAQEEETRAEEAYQVQEYKRARAGYEQACQAYEHVGVAGEHERLRHQALHVQQQALAARAEAEQAEAERYAAGPLSLAMAAQAEADQQWQAQQFAEASQGYGQAQELFQQAAEGAQRERTRQAAAAARQRMEETQTEAERAEARERFGKAFTQAQRLGEQGRAYEARGDFVGALSVYEEATRSFVQLRREAVLQAARETAEAARQRMEEVKKELEALMQWTGPQFAVAQQQEAEAEQARQRQDYEQATALFAQTCQSYEAARVEAEQEQARQRALQAEREQAERAKTHALELREKAGTGRGWSPSPWWLRKQAKRALINGDRLFQRGKYTEAWESYKKAASLFVVLQPREPETTKTPISWKRSRILPVAGIGSVVIVYAFYSLYPFRALERELTDGSLAGQPEKIAKVLLPPIQESPSLKPKEEPPVRLPEPEVPSTPSKEKPSAPTRTQETKGGEESPVSPLPIASEAPPKTQPSASMPPVEVAKEPPAPIKQVPSTPSTEKLSTPSPAQGTKEAEKSAVSLPQVVLNATPGPEPSAPKSPASKEKPPAPAGTQVAKSEKEVSVFSLEVVPKETSKPQPSAAKPSVEVAKVPPAPVKEGPSTKSKKEPAVRQSEETAKLSPPPQPSIPPPLSSISQAEVTAWLETYRRAWEEKDIDKLVQLGGVPAQQANKVREALSRYESFRVVFKDVDIRREETRATVSFTRVDIIDGRDRIHPDRKVLVIEKQGGSLVSRQ